MGYPPGKQVPVTVFIERMMPFELAFQVDQAFGNAGGLDSLWGLDGEPYLGDLIIIRCINPNGLKALVVILKRRIAHTPLTFSENVFVGVGVV